MQIVTILIAGLLVLMAAAFAGLLLLRFFITSEAPEDAAFDNPAIAPPSWPVAIWQLLQHMLGKGPRRLTYRRDRRGRFRKVRRF